mgnify:FL=1
MEIRENTEQNNETVHSMIRQHNAKFMTEFQDYSYHIEEEGELVAGIVAEAVFDTVEVEFLCVKENCRGKGYGRALLQYVEEQAENDGRKRILLNTYSFQAPEFYRFLGYEELLCVDPCFKEYKQYYFCKELNES